MSDYLSAASDELIRTGHDMQDSYYEEIRLSRAFARAVNTYVPEHYMAPEVKKAWDDLKAHYKKQISEGVE